MSNPKIVAAARRAVEIIAKNERSYERPLTKLLRPLFELLPVETQLRLARPAFNDITAAVIIANERWGSAGIVRVDGNEMQVGRVRDNGDFEVLGRGRTWRAAWEDADAREREATPWNWCPKCKQTVDDDMRTGEFRDGSEGTCVGCGTVYAAVAYEDGSWGLHVARDDDEDVDHA